MIEDLDQSFEATDEVRSGVASMNQHELLHYLIEFPLISSDSVPVIHKNVKPNTKFTIKPLTDNQHINTYNLAIKILSRYKQLTNLHDRMTDI